MVLVITFLLGMGNFACHTAVLGSGHNAIAALSDSTLRVARVASFALEFGLLCGALYAAEMGQFHWTWLYAGYTLVNLGAAWSIVTGRLG